jgi:7-cyano-7-deazaguanine synthase
MNKAVCLLSGGQDSTTTLFWALSKFDQVHALILDYGQRHRIEIESAVKIATIAKVPYKIVAISFFSDLTTSALIGDGDVNQSHPLNPNLPASFVPGRNIVFITAAAMYAHSIGAENVCTGVCQTDYSGYPDCRDETMKSLQTTLRLAMDFNLEIHTPLMWLTKSQTVALAISLPGCEYALKFSHTCYNGQFPPCGECSSCKLRAKGFQEAGFTDPIFSRDDHA